ncbi:DUF255 domain-containing protein [Aliamphritea ceti]|uniref:DUF255 domain-containing protein n=1 Tax=Aliamphritea ceti TaxID=1524258 RepID=UPI0021C395C5|nr:DUF255 domain-containing protein [Aliamphritea ceti]
MWMKQHGYRWLLGACVMLIGIAAQAANFGQEGGIDWQPWDKTSFDKAKSENKLILVNVGMEGCTACNRMERVTYTNQNVVDLINKHFVAIAVDAQARPDIGERYSDWAWPATAFLQPDATQVFAMAGNRLPRNFIPILNDLVDKQTAGTLKPDPRSPYAAAPEPVETELTKIRDQVRLQLDRALNDDYGWSRWGLNTEIDGPRLEHLYFRAHLYDNQNLRDLALATSKGFLETLDPVWGGAYIKKIAEGSQGVPARFSKLMAIPEKRISNQVNAITAFAEAYRITGDEAFREGMRNVDMYLTDWMLDSSKGYYANQKDEPEGLPEDWWPQDYWLLDTADQRLAYGVPPIDHAVYTDKNGEVIRAYVLAAQAFDAPEYLQKAVDTATFILQDRQQVEGWLLQSRENQAMLDDQRVHPHTEEARPFLRAQASMGRALLALYSTTGEQHWLDAAVNVADGTLATLLDSKNKGFFGTVPDSTANLIPPRKPLEDNAQAASFFYDLFIMSKLPRFETVAEETIRAVAAPSILAREGRITGRTGLALEQMTAAYVEFSVVAENANEAAQQLYAAGIDAYHPRKLIHFEKPGRYPQLGQASMFICNPDRCSLPLSKPEEVADVAESFRGGATSL